MDFTVENICGFLIKSRLMAADQMKAMKQRWHAEAKDATNLSQFTRWLVTNDYVTEYQASLLAKGHGETENFFLNQYRILDRLGRGHMAGVYKAAHSLGQIVAIKVLPPSKAKNPHLLGRFLREAKLALKLKHANTVRAFQVGEAAGLHYLVMEYLDGETLDEVLQRRTRLPPQEAVRLVYQALMGLQHIHEQGIVHRDLKPANMMLTPAPGPNEADTTLNATVKILDIGLGRAMFDEDSVDRLAGLPENLTGEGVLLGTPDYLAPEQARDPRAIDIRADIYSLGGVLYHCLTGQPPFPDRNILNQMVRHATETPKPLKDFNPAIPDGLQQVLNWMLAKQADQRYPTPERAAQALQVFLMADSAPVHAIEEAPQMRSYLTWLDTSAPASDADAASAPRTVPAPPVPPAALARPPSPPPAVPPLPAAKGAPSPSAKSGPVRRPKPAKKTPDVERNTAPKPVAAVPAAPVPALGAAGFDVELVAMPEADTSPAQGLLGFSPREWLLIGTGAGAMLVLVVLGFLIILLLRGGE